VSDSLGKMFRTIAEARAGSKADQDILSTLGLSVASLSGQSPDKVVLRVADALDQVADSGERARLAVASVRGWRWRCSVAPARTW